MASSTTLQHKTSNRPRYTPARVLGAFFIAYLGVTAMTALQHRQRDVLESTEAPTAVGDHAFYVLQRPLIWRQPVAALEEEKLLFLQSVDPIARDDSQMLKVAWWRRYHVYRDSEDTTKDRYYVKMAKGRYLPLGPEPALQD